MTVKSTSVLLLFCFVIFFSDRSYIVMTVNVDVIFDVVGCHLK